MLKKRTLGFTMLVLSTCLSSCYNSTKAADMAHRDSVRNASRCCTKRLNNLLRIPKIQDLSKRLNHFEIIVLQKNKCGGLCDESVYEYIELYSQPRQTKLILLAVNDFPTDWKKEFRDYPYAQNTEVVEISNAMAEKLYLNFAGTYHVTILKRKVLSWQAL